MENKEIIQRSIDGWKKKISILERSNNNPDDIRNALVQVAELTKNEWWAGNEELGYSMLAAITGVNDLQIRELHSKWLSDAKRALKFSEDTAKKLGYSTGSKCFLATAACGELSEEVLVLSHFRDTVLSKRVLGRVFIKIYYATSPYLAASIDSSIRRRAVARALLIRPLTFLVRILITHRA